MMRSHDILIIGGGISGLATAHWLALAGVSCEVWEADSRLGGKIGTERTEGYLTERSANLLMNFRPEITDFLRLSKLDRSRLAMSTDQARNRYIVHAGKLLAVPTRLGQLGSSPIWSWRSKWQMLREPWIPRGNTDTETVSDFIRRRLSNEMLETVFEPFVGGTLASDPDCANMASTLPRLSALENRYGSIAAGILINKILRRRTAMVQESFSFVDGMTKMIETLAAAPQISCRTSHRVIDISRVSGRWRVTAQTPEGERCLSVRQLVLSVPAYQAAKLVKSFDHRLDGLLSGIHYAPVSVVHLGYDRQSVPHTLDGNGFLVPRSEKSIINGNLWPSSLFSGRAPENKVLLTSYLGGAKNPEAVKLGDQTSVDLLRTELHKYLGISVPPEMVKIHRHARALPLYYGHYAQRCRDIGRVAAAHGGLHIEGNYIGGVAIRDRLVRSRLTAQRIVTELGLEQQNCSEGWDLLYQAVAS